MLQSHSRLIKQIKQVYRNNSEKVYLNLLIGRLIIKQI